ncbi:GyrI-like domain-containing protein [Aquimarina sp. AU58]|uniref:AraC family transcriptional regulator n=1 Tax=Aquimarina sp. AU58 TaxID=1874112 RepID=UPI000D6E0AE1|nr:GyrI-like domain-containing protein [Aquimarina sp. AU58]
MSENIKDSYQYRISNAITFIEENLKNVLTLDRIAQEACYSKYHFIRLFAAVTGETVVDYVRKRRVSESAHELILTQEPIVVIAERYQFDSQQAYTRAFQSVFKTSPGKYRKKGHRFVAFERYTLSPTDINTLQNDFVSMEPKIITITDRKLIGMRIKTSLANDTTSQMWQQFMPRRFEIKNNKNTGYYSVQTFDEDITFDTFTEDVVFEKWAAVEVTDFDHIPEDMTSYVLPGGKYAIFIHKGPVDTFNKTMNYIHGKWLPNSGYELDQRNHFAIMGDKYHGPHHPKSEEEIWVPIQ